MSENIFWYLAPDILQLHRQNTYSLFATGSQIHDADLVNVDGLYYMWLEDKENDLREPQPGILLIEDQNEHARISWITTARTVNRKDSVYRRAAAALRRRLKVDKQNSQTRLVELAPQQGRMTIDNAQDFMISPHDLMRALYPASDKIKSLVS
ncbi:MAG: pyridoxamine 5'-phosphate oxidase family protein [Neisseria sp.]|uniref:pyridoxamine 5'-phosphate oxidase family protein n=1 Tax=Neisseria sp. TaxID=192066 RepID=UPI0026DD4F84|nr:pyridoxamine 5'-phosphate oxidase family protein [Neisseria sp.]MDO4640927.1 pyridoxamine 5'-phosphate oxidase family protein [Neisseria sp.]